MATNKETVYIPLEDVESEHCALIVEKGLAQVKGVETHKVELNNRRAAITVNDNEVVGEAVKAIKDLGYGVPTVKHTYPVLGMTCASCAGSAESMVKYAPGVVDASVTATIDKYFNGDDLYALDNEKYADCRGQAYVMVTFAAENAKEWYGTMVAEDPNDPTSAISDDEVIETLLVGGTWCPTGKLYLCKWDTEHTILAVGVAADENPGVLLRQSHTFTKAGAAPVSEFVAPESQGVRTGTMKIAPHVASVRNYK
jgi:copper chaperone CopZ